MCLFSHQSWDPFAQQAKRQGKQLLLATFQGRFFSGWHPKNSVTPPHPGVNSNTGILSIFKKGHFFEMWVTPAEQLSHLNYTEIRGAQARRWSGANSQSLTTKADTYFLMSLHCCLCRHRTLFSSPLPTRTVISRQRQMPLLLIPVSSHWIFICGEFAVLCGWQLLVLMDHANLPCFAPCGCFRGSEHPLDTQML